MMGFEPRISVGVQMREEFKVIAVTVQHGTVSTVFALSEDEAATLADNLRQAIRKQLDNWEVVQDIGQ